MPGPTRIEIPKNQLDRINGWDALVGGSVLLIIGVIELVSRSPLALICIPALFIILQALSNVRTRHEPAAVIDVTGTRVAGRFFFLQPRHIAWPDVERVELLRDKIRVARHHSSPVSIPLAGVEVSTESILAVMRMYLGNRVEIRDTFLPPRREGIELADPLGPIRLKPRFPPLSLEWFMLILLTATGLLPLIVAAAVLFGAASGAALVFAVPVLVVFVGIALPVLFSNIRIDTNGIRFTYGPLRRHLDWSRVRAVQPIVGLNGRRVLLISTG